MELLLSVALGVGLATAVGFRIFVPFLVLGIAVRAGAVSLAPGFDWIGSPAALAVFSVATLLEVGAYCLPWVDNLLDVAATPVTVVAGMIATASVVADVSPLVRWTVAVIAGGGVAGMVQGGSVVGRGLSTTFTGGVGNFVLAAFELLGAVGFTVLALLLPLVALALAALVLFVAWKTIRRVGLRRRRLGQGAA